MNVLYVMKCSARKNVWKNILNQYMSRFPAFPLISHASSDSWMHVSCNSCEMKLQNDADKRLHEINDHGYQECQFCGVLYCSARELEDHLKSHHEQIEPSINISCDICEMIFKTKADMKFHQSRVHDYGKTCSIFPCDKCCYKGQDLASLERHMNESHVLIDLEELGIVKLPVYSRRMKQTFAGLNMDEEGSIDVDESEDELMIDKIVVKDEPQKKIFVNVRL